MTPPRFWYEKHISINHIIVIMKTEDYKAQAAAAAEVSAQAAKDAAKAEMNNLKQQGEEAKAAADSKVNDLKNQAANLKDQAADKIADLKDQAAEKAAEAKDKASGFFDKLKDKAADVLRAGADKVSDLADKIDNWPTGRHSFIEGAASTAVPSFF